MVESCQPRSRQQYINLLNTLQAALKKLANQRNGARLLSAPAGQLPAARHGPASGTGPGLHRAISGLSLRSTASTAGVLNGSSGRGRRRRSA